MINILFFFLCLDTSSSRHGVDGMHTTFKEDLDLERQLKILNKPLVKSIHTKFGYIVDCIDINKQPAFDHPLLKNHKLQRKPNFRQTITKASVNNSLDKPIVGLNKGSCPKGTVPIRRTTKDDLIRAKSILNTPPQDNYNTHVAEVVLRPSKPYYGVSGILSIYNPRVYQNQSSAGHLWVQNGQQDGINKIFVGWHVDPQLYGDDRTHMYALWTSDNFWKTGCYNGVCAPGFVQVDKENYIGNELEPVSVYGGMMYELTISLMQDPVKKDWWFRMNGRDIGYFPAALFFNLAAAEQVGWGGKTTAPQYYPSPPMGSGYFPDDDFVHACYFRQVSFQNELRQQKVPDKSLARTSSDNPDCFRVEYYGDQGGQAGYSLQFGGPGGNCAN